MYFLSIVSIPKRSKSGTNSTVVPATLHGTGGVIILFDRLCINFTTIFLFPSHVIPVKALLKTAVAYEPIPLVPSCPSFLSSSKLVPALGLPQALSGIHLPPTFSTGIPCPLSFTFIFVPVIVTSILVPYLPFVLM